MPQNTLATKSSIFWVRLYNLAIYLSANIIGLFVKKDIILFESIPDFGGSPWMIYKELQKRGFERKYRLVWAVDSCNTPPNNIKTFPFFGKHSFKQLIELFFLVARTKMIVENNRFIQKFSSRTFRLHAQHGAPLKKCFDYTFALGKVDAILSLSENTASIEQQIFPSAKENLVVLGYPSNDRLFEEINLHKNGFWQKHSLSKDNFNKIIGWLPTYRQHRGESTGKTTKHFPYGIPLIQSESELISLNHLLKEKNILLAIQMHHAQMENFSKKSFSNIVLISQDVKYEMNVSTANLMQSFDALITDYSAAYHEYILLDRPIALSIDDYEEYAKNPGFSIDYFDLIKGVYLKSTSDLMRFINDVSNGIDSAKKERESSKLRFHKYIDNQSTKRVVDFLVKKVEL